MRVCSIIAHALDVALILKTYFKLTIDIFEELQTPFSVFSMKKRRSKLELYIAALEALAVNGAMNTTRLSLKSKVNGGPLKRILLDLTERDLVERRTLGRKNVYAATSKTRAILSHVEELGRILPITEMTATSCRIVRY